MKAPLFTLAQARRARIEIIPLIDVIFFLLATFVLFTLSLNKIRSIPLDLPFPGKDQPADVVNLQVSGAGAVYWNTELMDQAELPGRIAVWKTQEADPKFMISGDEKAGFGATVAVLDELRKAGIKKFSVETKPRGTGR